MFKPNQLLLFFFLAFPAFVFAEESITITTYYPSPYGSYNELTTASNTYLATSSGRVGIGTAGPTTGSRLHIVQPSYQFIDLAVESALPSIRLVDTETNQVSYGFEVDGNNLYIDAHTYANRYENTYGSPLVTLQSSGNVGIGTTSPGYKVEVNQPTAADVTNLALVSAGQSAEGAINRMVFRTGTTLDSATRNSASIYAINSNAGSHYGSLAFATMNATTLTEAMRITSTGNVGIGTTGPAGKLHVNYTGTTEAGLYINNTSGNDGAAAVSWRHNGTQVGSVTTASGSTTYNTTSDARLKENIKDTLLGLDVLNQIQVRDFNFIADPSKRIQGFIAQELYAIYPEAVSVGGDDPTNNPWGVDYGRITPLILKSVQELGQRIQQQQSQIQQQQQQIQEQQKRIEVLEAKLNVGQ